MMTNLAIKLFIVMLLVSAAGGGWLYVQNLQHRLELARVNQAKLEDALTQQEVVLKKQSADITQMQQLNVQINKDFAAAVQARNTLQKKFEQSTGGGTRDFGNIALAKPGLVEPLINKGTQYALRCNELVTGSPVRPTDKNNNVCPELVKQ